MRVQGEVKESKLRSLDSFYYIFEYRLGLFYDHY
jgi:hypothetical protein